MRRREIAQIGPRFGYERIAAMLRREGWPVGRKRVRRLYRLEGSQLRMGCRRCRNQSPHRGPTPVSSGPGQYWAMDFVHDQLVDGRKIRMLTVVRAFERLSWRLSLPVAIVVDKGSGVHSKTMGEWAWRHKVQLDFIRLGKPTENGMIESFSGRSRDQCLSTQVFTSLDDARQKIKAWGADYNEHRPHGFLGHPTPTEFIRQGQK